jgi:murein DD-endopeptidase MepM/ murein hydrolase activator NlpD
VFLPPTAKLFPAALLLFLFAPPMHAQEMHACGRGVDLRLSAPAAPQGGLLQVRVRSGRPLADLKAQWNGRDLPFWTDPRNPAIERALLGIDLERAPGDYELTLSAKNGDDAVTCAAAVSVSLGRFRIERLKVAEKFVEVNPQDEERAAAESKRLHEIYATVTPERLWRGNFRLPLDGVRKGGNFGTRRILNGEPRSPHTGVDFPAPMGTPVHAAQSGRVVLAEPLFFSGNTVLLDHGLGVYTFYGHLETIDVHVGDLVAPGALLGKVGATGRVTGPHLHWGLVVDGARVNATQIVGLGGD